MKIGSHHLLTAILLCATGLSGYYVATTHPHPILHVNNNNPDRYALHFRFDQYDDNGNILKTVSAAQAIHIKNNDLTFLFQPKMNVFDKQGKLWKLSADRAKSIQGGKKIIAWGNVQIVQPASKKQTEYTLIKTTWMQYLQDKNVAYTPEATTIQRPDSTTQGTGMIANFKTGVYQLLSDVHVVYTPQS